MRPHRRWDDRRGHYNWGWAWRTHFAAENGIETAVRRRCHGRSTGVYRKIFFFIRGILPLQAFFFFFITFANSSFCVAFSIHRGATAGSMRREHTGSKHQRSSKSPLQSRHYGYINRCQTRNGGGSLVLLSLSASLPQLPRRSIRVDGNRTTNLGRTNLQECSGAVVAGYMPSK